MSRGGDKVTELEDIYNWYFKDVYLFVYSLLKNQHVAEDITSETFLKAMNSLDSFEGKSDVRSGYFKLLKIPITPISEKIIELCQQINYM